MYLAFDPALYPRPPWFGSPLMLDNRNLLKKFSALSLGVGSSYLTYYYVTNHRKGFMDDIEVVMSKCYGICS